MARNYDYYSVAKGRKLGVFFSWFEARKQVQGYSGCIFKGFNSFFDAKAWLVEHGLHFVQHAKWENKLKKYCMYRYRKRR